VCSCSPALAVSVAAVSAASREEAVLKAKRQHQQNMGMVRAHRRRRQKKIKMMAVAATGQPYAQPTTASASSVGCASSYSVLCYTRYKQASVAMPFAAPARGGGSFSSSEVAAVVLCLLAFCICPCVCACVYLTRRRRSAAVSKMGNAWSSSRGVATPSALGADEATDRQHAHSPYRRQRSAEDEDGVEEGDGGTRAVVSEGSDESFIDSEEVEGER
jgi:hypothetical protein